MVRRREKIIAAILCTAFTCNQGCMTLKKEEDFSSLMQPVAYRSASVEQDEPESESEDELQGVLGVTKSAVATTGKVIGAGVLLVGILIFKIWLDDDDDEDEGFDPNPLWRKGYGFNNPNVDRIKNCQPVVNFDGSVAD